MKTLDDFNFKNKKALIRVDFNVPLKNDFTVSDASRIQAAKTTITKVLDDGGSCVLLSHLGRPKGIDNKYSLRHIVSKATEILGTNIVFIDDCIGEKVAKVVSELQGGELVLLENLRFYPEEKAGDAIFAKQLSNWGDIYINDAFGTAHRAHASTTTIAKFFCKNKCFGNLMAKEIESIDKVLNHSEKPVTAILGGSKVSSKIDIITNLIKKTDHILIGGGMAFTFIKALGGCIGDSLVENDKLNLALKILEEAKQKNTQIHLPVDTQIADAFSADANIKIVDIHKIPLGWMGLDIGPRTSEKFAEVLEASKTILWNGPLGVFEMNKFAEGTIALGRAVARATKNGAFSLVGGGDSIAAVKQFGFDDKVSYVSTGGGAMLESLEGKVLPGIAAILNS
ncbi:MAG: phosphoglycerate kinase [Tenacibaculum sp.]